MAKLTTQPGMALRLLLAVALLAASATAQQPAPADQPKIRVNMVNSCQPAPAETEQISKALAKVAELTPFAPDFEISRGRSTLTEAQARAAGVANVSGPVRSNWIRIRRDLAEHSPVASVQFSLTEESGSASELIALHLRETKADDVLQIAISAAVPGSAAQLLDSTTPPQRIQVERFGKSSLVLRRCEEVDQTIYNPLFIQAAKIFEAYRKAMAVRTVAAAEMTRLNGGKESKAAGANH